MPPVLIQRSNLGGKVGQREFCLYLKRAQDQMWVKWRFMTIDYLNVEHRRSIVLKCPGHVKVQVLAGFPVLPF